MSTTLAVIRRAARLSALTGFTSTLMPFYLVGKLRARARGQEPTMHNAWVRRWARAMLRTFGVEVLRGGHGTGDSGRGRLVVCNHRSAIDIVLLQSLFGGHLVSRGDLSGWPLIGPAARAVGTIFLDRTSARSGAASLRIVEQWLGERRTVILFPEGTTFVGDAVQPFHAASFVAAARARAEVVPVGVAYETSGEASFVGESFGAHLLRVSAAKAIRLAVTVGGPSVPPAARSEAAAFSRSMRDHVQSLVDSSRARVDAAEREA